MKKFLALLATVILLPVAAKAAPVSSTFDSDAEGWTVNLDGTNLTWHATGGNPGGFISAEDNPVGVTWYFLAPAKFLGNQSSQFGLTLCFDLKQFGSGNQEDIPPDVVLSSGLTVIYIDNLPAPNTDPIAPPHTGSVTPFTHYEIALDSSAGWQKVVSPIGPVVAPASDADILGVLGNLTSLQIKGEFRRDVDQGSLDNVILGCIPEPSTTALVLAALTGFGWFARRRG
jgi:hypothetical protein